jgi:hypothetical protein
MSLRASDINLRPSQLDEVPRKAWPVTPSSVMSAGGRLRTLARGARKSGSRRLPPEV